MKLFDWKLLTGAVVASFAFVGFVFELPKWEDKKTIIERCEQSEEPEVCLANVEANHDECYRHAASRRTSRYATGPNFGFYFECIETSPEEAREKYPL